MNPSDPRLASSTTSATSQEKLGVSIFYSVLGQLVYVVSQLGILSALARFEDIAEVGEFGLAMAVATPIFVLAQLGLRTGQATDVTQRFSFAEYSGLTILSSLLGMILSLFIGFLFLSDSSGLAILFMVSANKVVESVSILSYGSYQQVGRMDLTARSLCLRGVLSVTAFVCLLALNAGTALALTAQFVVWSLVAFGVDYPSASRFASDRLVTPSLQPRRLLTLARENLPLGVGQFLGAATVSLPRLALKMFVGLEAVGLFTLVSYFFQAGTIVANAVAQAIVGRFAYMWRSGQAGRLRRVAWQLVIVMLVCSAVGILFVAFYGGSLLALLFGEGARAGEELFLLIACALGLKLVDLVPQSILNAQRRFRAVLLSQAMSLVAAAVLLPPLVWFGGVIGAGVSVLGIAIVRLSVLVIAMLRQQSS